jgi:hypothetical protein
VRAASVAQPPAVRKHLDSGASSTHRVHDDEAVLMGRPVGGFDTQAVFGELPAAPR